MFPLIIQTPPISNPRNKQYLLTRVTPSNGCSIGRRPRDKTDEITRKRRIKEKRNKISRDIPLPVLDIRDGRLAKADFLMESGNSQTTAISSGIRYEERKIYDRESSEGGGFPLPSRRTVGTVRLQPPYKFHGKDPTAILLREGSFRRAGPARYFRVTVYVFRR